MRKYYTTGIPPLVLLLFFFCVGFPAYTQTSGIAYAIIPENPLPGEPVTIGLNANIAQGIKYAVLYSSGNKRLARASFFRLAVEAEKPPILAALIAVPATANAGFAYINIESDFGKIMEIPLVIKERQFNSEVIDLNDTLTGIRVDPDPKKTAESEQLWAILNKTGTEIYSTGAFKPPVTSTRRTSFFGDRRVYKYSSGKTDSSIHAGIDYGVPTGTPVTACAAGKIVLARHRIVTGNSVIIEHAPGIYSLYYHLNKILVNENTVIPQGVKIGEVGATGLATGPHLHWEIRVSGENSDPDALIQRSLLDKEAILAKIGN